MTRAAIEAKIAELERRTILHPCHEEVTDTKGLGWACDRPAVGWRIDPEADEPYPVCAAHHRWPYADAWVERERRFLAYARGVLERHGGPHFCPDSEGGSCDLHDAETCPDYLALAEAIGADHG